MKRLATLVLAAGFAIGSLLALGQGASATPFSDVPANHWAYQAIQSLAADGLVEGYPDGKFKGEVLSDGTLLVGEGAYVEAKVEVGEIIISGAIVGNIKATRAIEIHAPGRVKGDLDTPTLQIEKGVIFDGRSSMESAVAPVPVRGYERPASQPASITPASPKSTPIK